MSQSEERFEALLCLGSLIAGALRLHVAKESDLGDDETFRVLVDLLEEEMASLRATLEAPDGSDT